MITSLSKTVPISILHVLLIKTLFIRSSNKIPTLINVFEFSSKVVFSFLIDILIIYRVILGVIVTIVGIESI